MTYPPYLRARARDLRLTKRLSLDEIAERLALPKTTVYYWIRDLPLGRPRRENAWKGTLAMQAKYRRLREAAYARGWGEYDDMIRLPTFRDFVVLYIAEGYKRNRNVVAIANSDDRVVAVAVSWLRSLTARSFTYSIQYSVFGRRSWRSTPRRSSCSGSPTADNSRGGRGDRLTA